MGIILSLKLQHAKENYYPGETIKGVLSIIVPKPIHARKVQILFEGKEHTRVERFGRIGGTDLTHAKPYEPNVRVYEEEEYIVSKTIKVLVAQKEKLFGRYNELFPFEFQLPEGTLPSITTQSENKTGIIYEIKAKIDRPRSIDPKTYCEVKVEQPGYETYPTAPIERFREDFDGMLR